ncbi:MAG: hypothetical protein V1833_05730 [Elusimicrobiota bacterium]
MLKALVLTLGILFPETFFNTNFPDIQKLSFNTPQGLIYDIYTDRYSTKHSTIPCSATIYGRPSHKVVMLLHGLVKDGKNDPRLVGLAKVFVRDGYSVFVPDIEGLKNSQLGPDEVNEVHKYLAEMNRIFKESRIKGVMSFCYSNAPLIAALSSDEKLHQDVIARAPMNIGARGNLDPNVTILPKLDFLIFWDGCYNLKEMFRYTLLGYYRTDGSGTTFIREPDVELKQAISNQKFFFTTSGTNNLQPTPCLLPAGTSLVGSTKVGFNLSVQQFLSNQKPELFDAYYNKLPKTITDCIEFISPKNHFARGEQKFAEYPCKIFFIHTLDDPVIPYQETVQLYNSCSAKNKKLLLLSIYEHVEKKINLGNIMEVLRDMKNLYSLVREL